MFYPKLTEQRQQTLTTEAFLGYDHDLKLSDGEFYDMENLTSDCYPLLAPRVRRGTVQALSGAQAICARDRLCWVQNQVLHINGASMEAYMPSVNIKAGEKQLVSMGAYLCIFPDGIYFNTEDYSDNGYMGHENTVDAAETPISVSLCLADGQAQKHGGAHRTYKSLASVETWKAKGIDDPIAYFQKEVDELNKNNKNKNSLKISDHSPELYLGYFPFISMMNKMDIKKYVDYFNLHNSFEFDLYELLSSLIYARLVNPCSKHRTFHEVLPQLRDGVHFSYDQLLDGLEFIGNDYGKFIEIFNEQTKKFYDINTSKTYFDCSNFYFEIDREDDFRRKGPSKENRKAILLPQPPK